MPALVDNLIAFRLLYLLTRKWKDTDAYKLGIIDEDGKLLKKMEDLKSQDEKDAYNYLTRLVFNVKRLIEKVPGGKSMLGTLVAAYFLIKEGIEQGDLNNLEEKYIDLTNKLNEGLILVEEQILVEKFLVLMSEEMGGIPTNATTGVALKDNPMKFARRSWKNLPKTFGAATFEVTDHAYNGFKGAKAKGAKWDNHLVPSDDDKDSYEQIRQYSKTYSTKPIAIKRKGHEQYMMIKH